MEIANQIKKEVDMLKKSLKIFSTIWITIATIFILFGLISAWYFEGFHKLKEVMNPFNIANFFMIFIVLSPGLGAKLWAEKMEDNRNKE